MFLTRSIRRELVLGLGLVILMLLMLGIAGVSGMLAYRACVHDLRQMEAAPSRTDLALACAGLIEPLFLNAPADLEHREVRAVQPLLTLNQSLWAERLKKLNQQLNKFRNRLAKGYNEHRTLQVTQSYPIIMGKLDQIQRTLTGLEIRRGAYLVEPPDQKQVILDLMLQDVSLLQTLVQEIPSAERSLGEILVDADTAYRWRIWVIGICSVVVIGLLIGLFRCGYSWIFVPIRRLHDVASRVANGDYRHRLNLPGRDEMADLASTFNRMIDRFQRDKSDADREAMCRGEQLVRNKHLADLGKMASGIAHEINNPLSAISLAADSLKERLSEPDSQFGSTFADRELLRTYMNMIAHSTDRCQQITRRTLDIARGNNGPRVRYDLTKIVIAVLDMVKYIKGFEHLTVDFDRNQTHPADVNSGEIEQVVLNLVINAFEAMEDQKSGTVTITIDETVDEVILNVQDTGYGMTPEVLANLYKPFYTKKPSGRGTGLGLSIVDRIVGDHKGRIEALSDGPGTGSTFRVHLPRKAQEAARAA